MGQALYKEKKQTVSRGFAILSIASILVKLMSLIFVPVMRSLLGGSYGYGVFGAANEVYAFIYVITTAGMPVAVSKLVSELSSQDNPREAEKAFRLARTLLFVIGLFFSLLMGIFAKPIASLMNNEESWAGILFLAPSIMICSVMAAYRGYFQGKQNMTPTAISQVIEQFVHVAIAIMCVIALRDKGIVWAVAGASMGTAVGSFVSFSLILSYRNLKRNEIARNSRQGSFIPSDVLIRKLIYYSIPITLSSAIQYGGNLIDAALISGRLQAGGFSPVEATSLYGDMIATRQLINVPTALVSALCVSILPALTALFASGQRDQTKERAEYGFKLLYLVIMPIAFGMAFFSKEIYGLLGFGSNHMLLTSLSFSLLLLGTVHLQNSIMQSVNRLFQTTLYLGISVLVKALLNYILLAIPFLNIYGAVISTYVAYVIPLILNHLDLKKKANMDLYFYKKAMIPLVASLVMTILSFGVKFLIGLVLKGVSMPSYVKLLISFMPAFVVAVLVYFYILKRYGGIEREDVEGLSPKIASVMAKLRLIK